MARAPLRRASELRCPCSRSRARSAPRAGAGTGPSPASHPLRARSAPEPTVAVATPSFPTHCSSAQTPAQSYPARYPPLSPGEIAERASELRRASGGRLDQVDLDAYGFVNVIRRSRSDAPWGPRASTWMAEGRGWLGHSSTRRSSGHLRTRWPDCSATAGVTSPQSDASWGSSSDASASRNATTSSCLLGRRGHQAEALRNVWMSGHFWPGVTIPTKTTIGPAGLAARLVGATYEVLIVLGPPPHRR